MPNSWELTDEQYKEVNRRTREVGAEYDPETGKKWNTTENTGDGDTTDAREEKERVR